MPQSRRTRFIVAVSGLLVLALALLAAACSGPQGPAGPAGPSGAAAGGNGVKIKITGVTIPADRKPVVTFKLTDSNDTPIKVEDLDGTPPTPNFTIAKIVVTDGYSQYVNYFTQVVTGTAYTINGKTAQPAMDSGTKPVVDNIASGGKVTAKGSGEFTYTFGQTIPQDAYDANATTVVGVSATRNTRAQVSNDLFYFVPAGGQPKDSRLISSTQTCNQCHDPLSAHGGQRVEFGLCVTCHTPQNVDPKSGNVLDMKVMVHKIHDASSLPSVKAGGLYNVASTDFSGITWPQDVRNCTTCHKDGPQADNWKTKPSAAACGSCHDNIDFKTGKNHPGGPQQDDKNCASCHVPDGPEFGMSVSGAHTIPAASTQLAGLTAQIVKVTNTAPGQKPVVEFKLADGKGNAVDPTNLDNLAVTLAWPTTDYKFRQQETVRKSPTPATATAPAGPDTPNKAIKLDNGDYAYTMNMTVDPTWTGSLAVGMEGYRNVKISVKTQNDTSVREAFFNPVAYAAVTDPQVVARRKIVDVQNCNQCHKDLGNPAAITIHGGSRRNPEYCVFCHNPNTVDEPAPPATKGAPTEAVQYKYFIHSLHMGDKRAVATAFGDQAQAKTKDIHYPGNQQDCNKCHVGTSFQLPLPATALPMATTTQGLAGKTVPPITAACLGCHIDSAATGHFQLNTTATGQETCNVCHAQNADFAMDKVHKH